MAAMPSSSIFESCVRDIEAAYKTLGYALGWRFLSVSQSVLDSPVRIALVTLNPGGDRIRADHPSASCEKGVSYFVESWDASPGQSPLQVQVQKLFEALRLELKYKGSNRDLMEESLIAHFVPFRSSRFADLPRRAEALEFGRSLWKLLLPHAKPKLAICLGREVQAELRALLPAAASATLYDAQSYATGWGTYSADIDFYRTPAGTMRLLFLPHLSTWKLFTSGKCRESMRVIVEAAAKDL